MPSRRLGRRPRGPGAPDAPREAGPGRDRYVDLLRVVALAAVMVGHFLMTGVVVDSSGRVVVGNSLSWVAEAKPLTWAFQVMPVFFAVGGFVHALALASVQRRGGTYADFVAVRLDRLLRPTGVFVAAGLLAGAVVDLTGRLDVRAVMVLRVVAQPLWFVGIYLAVMAIAPWMHAAHRRWGWRVLAALVLATATVDALRFGFGAPAVLGYLNFPLVWLAVHQCGFFYADGWQRRVGLRGAAVLSGTGLGVTVLLVALGPYPLSMVSLPGESVSNMTPPSLALLTFSAWLLGLALLMRPAGTRLLAHGRVWLVVVGANTVVMTAFLWHLSAIVLVNGGLVLLGVPVFPPVGSTAWWLLRIPLLAAVAAVLAGLVALLGRFERAYAGPSVPAGPRPSGRLVRHRDGLAAAGLSLALLGVLGLSVAGFAGVLALRSATLVVLPMTSVGSAALLGAGLVVVRTVAAVGPVAGVTRAADPAPRRT